MSNMLRGIPSVSELLESPPLKSLVNRVNPSAVLTGVRQFLDDMRTHVQAAAANVHVPAAAELAQRIADWISAGQPSPLSPVINATGMIVNRQLGGVPFADEAIQAIAVAARSYVNSELDLTTGERCEPTREAEELLISHTGAEAAAIVNNQAAATCLALASLARGREVVVSRGQIVETDFRLHEIAAVAGAVLREVGTTNKTRLDDYSAAITPHSAGLLQVRASDFAIVGCQENNSLAELVALARKSNLPLIEAMDTAALIDLSRYGIAAAPLPADSIRAGADLVIFGGDKLVGGPACGILVGRRTLIQKLASHPLMTAVRADKLTLAALAATLRLYQDLELAERSVPVLSLISTSLENLRQRAERLAPQIVATGVAAVEVVASQTFIAGAPLAGQALPTIHLALAPMSRSVEQLAAALRGGIPPVVGRIEGDKLLLDLRSVQPRQDLQLVAAIEALQVAREPIAPIASAAPPVA